MISKPANKFDGGVSPFDDDFATFVHSAMEQLHVPGLSIAVIYGDHVYSNAYGMATLPGTPATPETLYAAGSTTKSFTTAALALLLEEKGNKLTWGTPISSLIRDDFVLQDEYATADVSLEDAASHRTSLPRHEECYGAADKTSRDIVRRMRHLPLMAHAIRTKWEYCNTPWIGLSLLLEKWSGAPIEEVFKKKIWEPLGMNRTHFSNANMEQAAADGLELARGYHWNEERQKFVEEAFMDLSIVSGAGANLSSVVEYAKYLQMYLKRSGPLSEAAHQELRRPRAIVPPDEDEERPPIFAGPDLYALGWFISVYRGVEIIWHPGGLLGFNACMAYVPSLSFGSVQFANANPGGNHVQEAILYRLLDDQLGIPEEERFDFVEKNLRDTSKLQEAKKATRTKLYPSVAEKVYSSLPLEAYQGTYTSIAYQSLTFALHKQNPCVPGGDASRTILRAEAYDKVWPHAFELEHVSGEHFIAWELFPKGRTAKGKPATGSFEVLSKGVKAEFRVGPDGKVTELGIAIEPSLGERKMWWKRD